MRLILEENKENNTHTQSDSKKKIVDTTSLPPLKKFRVTPRGRNCDTGSPTDPPPIQKSRIGEASNLQENGLQLTIYHSYKINFCKTKIQPSVQLEIMIQYPSPKNNHHTMSSDTITQSSVGR